VRQKAEDNLQRAAPALKPSSGRMARRTW
jgi:hypothetical protein